MNRRSFFLSAAALAATPAFPQRIDRGEVDLETLLDVTSTPGLAARGVVKGKKIDRFAGVDADTIFSAASLTKPVFAMSVRYLVREGKLDWNKPLQDYAPLGLTGDAVSITAEHVLMHGTGLVNWRFDTKAELASSFKPGTQWRYSGEGYVLLQRVVEKIVGKPLGIHLNETLLPRLGMSQSTFSWTPEIEKRAAKGHDVHGAPLEKSANYYARAIYDVAVKAGSTPDRMAYDQMIEAAKKFGGSPLPIAVAPNAAGSLWTTVHDYATFLNRSVRDQAEHPDEYTPRNRVNRKISWTLSWGVDSSLDVPSYFHWGDGPGVKNIAWWQPANKTALVIFTNSDHGASAWHYLLRHLLDADPLAPEWI
ncbi:MAG TPA: serine hydrolase domain-containing protein [Thermoanaerobaculia bacterium]|nr:serine hydrolase domain-containing protein [Thermoanaerobaculia bacterium]